MRKHCELISETLQSGGRRKLGCSFGGSFFSSDVQSCTSWAFPGLDSTLDPLVCVSLIQVGHSRRFKLLINPDPNEEGDSRELIRTKAYENGVLALPGTVFFPDGRKTAYVRASFSLSTEEQVNEALKRLRVVLLKERDRK